MSEYSLKPRVRIFLRSLRITKLVHVCQLTGIHDNFTQIICLVLAKRPCIISLLPNGLIFVWLLLIQATKGKPTLKMG